MTRAKRHHWWPIAQSTYWTGSNGHVFVTRSNGSVFPANPLNIGVESELYTRFATDGSKDTEIEEWFGETIDGPATVMIEHLLDAKNVHRSLFSPDPSKAETARALGAHVNPYVDKVNLPFEIRVAIARYLAALLVRHPRYLEKLIEFHGNEQGVNVKNRALDNMLLLYQKYAEGISKSVLMISRRVGDSEYLYADGGLMVKEPWRTAYNIPFDIHAPLTPDIAMQVLPMPTTVSGADLTHAMIVETTKQGVARQNRIVLGGAERFVFSRQIPPVEFIVKHFGKPAPENIGYWIEDGRLKTVYDPSRR